MIPEAESSANSLANPLAVSHPADPVLASQSPEQLDRALESCAQLGRDPIMQLASRVPERVSVVTQHDAILGLRQRLDVVVQLSGEWVLVGIHEACKGRDSGVDRTRRHPFRRLPRKAYFGKGVLCLQLGGERQESSTTLPKRKRLNDPIVVKEVIGEVPSDVVRSVAYALGVRGGGEEQESCVLDPRQWPRRRCDW